MGSVDNSDSDYPAIGAMDLGCIIFAGPFFILVGIIILAVIFNWR
jgi:hypothetical protein